MNITNVCMICVQLEFEAVGGGGKDTSVAVDDVSLLAHPCESEGLFALF